MVFETHRAVKLTVIESDLGIRDGQDHKKLDRSCRLAFDDSRHINRKQGRSKNVSKECDRIKMHSRRDIAF